MKPVPPSRLRTPSIESQALHGMPVVSYVAGVRRGVSFLDEVAGSATASVARNSKTAVSVRVMLQFSEQLLTLLKAGLPIDRALHTAGGAVSSKKMGQVVNELVLKIEKGSTFSDAIKHYPNVFPRLYVNMIKAGEEGGILATVLERVNDYYAKSVEFRNYVITSSIYPAILLVFGVLAVFGLLTFVVPKFAEVFASMDKEMPPTAAFLIDVASWLQSNWGYLIGTVCATVVIYKLAMRNAHARDAVDRLLLRLPFVGGFIAKMQFAQVCRTWGTLLAAGVPILTSLRIVQGVTSYGPIAHSLAELAVKIKDGQTVSGVMFADKIFPKIMGQLSKVGEESGALDAMVLRVADQFEKDVQRMTRSFVAAFEPTMILVIGGVIGFVVVSMLLAVFALNDMPI